MKNIIAVMVALSLVMNSQQVFANIGSGVIEMIPWEEVNGIVPKYSKFIVMDVETGKRFHVQRRAGSHHADVQPLTSKDTKIMKDIYDGKWSWKRRAIIIIYKNQWIAASMHGMPHGAGALKNNFPGHFCIHFYGSTTHRTNFMDLSHKLMILKAAGKLEKYIEEADPYEIIRAYIAGLKQQDPRILSMMSLQQIKWEKHIHVIENIHLNRMPILPSEDLIDELSLEVPVEIELLIKDSGRKYFKGKIYLIRFSHADGWKVDSKRLLNDKHFISKQ